MLFFFGTLMHPPVMEVVLDRPFDPADLRFARLPGFTRRRAANADYPVLARKPGAYVDGLALERYSKRDLARIDHFEDEEYVLEPVWITLADGEPVHARAYMTIDGVFELTDRPWSFEAWREAEAASYLDRCREWMADFVEIDA